MMKEIHAYKNDDGTYRVECLGVAYDNGEYREVVVKAARAKIDMEVLAEFSPDKTLYTLDIKEE